MSEGLACEAFVIARKCNTPISRTRPMRIPNSALERRPKPAWWKHFLAVAIGGVGFWVSLSFGYGYGGSSVAAGAAIIFAIVAYYDDYRNQIKFWITVGLLALAQLPLVMAVGPLVERFKFVLLLAFGFVDFVFVALVISWVCRT